MSYWSEIVEQHGPDVWRTAYRLLSRTADANDCYQETFLQAFEYSREHAIECWPGVLRRIATARALDMLRQRYRSSAANVSLTTLTDEPGNGQPGPDVCAELRESMEHLRRAMAELPADQAQVFWLSEVEFMSHHEIGLQLGASTGLVALWLHRAKQKLRELLAARGVTNEVSR